MKKHSLALVSVALFVIFSINLGPSFCAAEDKPIELRFASFLPLQHHNYVNVHAPFIKKLEARSKGRVKVTYYPSATLGHPKDHYDMVVQGIADIVAFIPAYTPGRFPLTEVMELPLGIPSATVGSRVFWEMYENELNKEYREVKVLFVSTIDPAQINMTKKLVKTMDDLKGQRLRIAAPPQIPLLKAWGASPVRLAVSEVYDSLNKGVVDGALISFSAMRDYKLDEVIKHHTIINASVLVAGVIMSKDTWNNLPPDIQKIIDDITGLKWSVHEGNMWDESCRLAMEQAEKKGGEIYKLSPEERAKWMERINPIREGWIAGKEKKGLPGRQVFEAVLSRIEKYSK